MVVLVVHGLPGSSKTSLSRALVFRDRFREFLHVSKDFCKSTLLLLRDADDASCDGGDAWRDRGSLLKRLARCRETLAESSSVLVEDLDLESCFAERLVELATSCSLPSRPDDDTLNAWSYQVMLAVTESVLGKWQGHVILDAPLYRLDVVQDLGEVFSRTGTDVYVLACYVGDEKIWDDRLRRRKQAGGEVVDKPGSVREVMAIYMDQRDRKKECDAAQKIVEGWNVKGTIQLDMGSLSIRDAVGAVEALVSQTPSRS